MSTTHSFPSSGRTTPPGTRPQAEQRAIWQRARDRGSVVIAAAIAHGDHHLVPVIQRIAHYTAVTELAAGRRDLPHPGQVRLGREVGRCERAVRAQLRLAEQRGYVLRYTSAPIRRPDGTFTRQTTRYVLCDRRWRGFQASPVQRRRRLSGPVTIPQVVPAAPTPVEAQEATEASMRTAAGDAVKDQVMAKVRAGRAGWGSRRRRRVFPTGSQLPVTSPGLEAGGPAGSPPGGFSPAAASTGDHSQRTERARELPWVVAGLSRAEWLRRRATDD